MSIKFFVFFRKDVGKEILVVIMINIKLKIKVKYC